MTISNLTNENLNSSISSVSSITIGVVGYGRFGSLWAQRFAHYGFCTLVSDKSIPDSNTISSSHLSSQASLSFVTPSQLKKARLVFFCVPISSLKLAIKETLPFLSRDCVVCDTCSVKTHPLEWMNSLLAYEHEILGTHPLFGPDSSNSADYSEKDKIVVCRSRISDYSYNTMLSLLRKINLTVYELSAVEHDRQAVYSQGITHLVGRMLQKLNLTKELVTTRGYEALLEIIQQTCNDSDELFFDLQNYNTGSKKMWKQLCQALQDTLLTLDNQKNKI